MLNNKLVPTQSVFHKSDKPNMAKQNTANPRRWQKKIIKRRRKTMTTSSQTYLVPNWIIYERRLKWNSLDTLNERRTRMSEEHEHKKETNQSCVVEGVDSKFCTKFDFAPRPYRSQNSSRGSASTKEKLKIKRQFEGIWKCLSIWSYLNELNNHLK